MTQFSMSPFQLECYGFISPLFNLSNFGIPSLPNLLNNMSFIVRARVLKLYRQALRITRRAPVDSRAELRRMIRQEMESNRNCSDKQRIRFLMSEALERLKRLDEMLDMQGH